MKRYIDFEHESWPDRADGRMQAARWDACMAGIDAEPPAAGVIDTAPIALLSELIACGWLDVPPAPSDLLFRKSARHAMLATLMEDADCLAPEEHTLVEKMLIGDGTVTLTAVPEFEAAYTLRMRLWCDIGMRGDAPCAQLDAELMTLLPDLLMRKEHKERRGRVFVYDGLMHGLLYLTGFLDDRLPTQRFIEEVLNASETPDTQRLARNFLEAAYDCELIAGCTLLLHASLAVPETLVLRLASQRMHGMPMVTPDQLVGSMNGLLPEEAALDLKLRLAISGALRPEIDAEDAAQDLRMLIKQGTPIHVLREVMAGMLCVLPTEHMLSALTEMHRSLPRWITPLSMPPGAAAAGSSIGLVH